MYADCPSLCHLNSLCLNVVHGKIFYTVTHCLQSQISGPLLLQYGVMMLLCDSLYDILQESLVKGAREPRRLTQDSWLPREKSKFSSVQEVVTHII